jgi:hypothetical protein
MLKRLITRSRAPNAPRPVRAEQSYSDLHIWVNGAGHARMQPP